MSQIGTGEGAQAYGHGLYFAERRGIAEEYKRALSRGEPPRLESMMGEPVSLRDYADDYTWQGEKPFEANAYDTFSEYAENTLRHYKSTDDARRAMNERLSLSDDWIIPRERENAKAMIGFLDKIEANPNIKNAPIVGGGNLYKVQLDARPDELLDYDLPMSEQPQYRYKI